MALLAAGSWLSVPMTPVPMTLQTLALLLLAIGGGWRLALAATFGWLAAGLIGAPVFAGGGSGWARLWGPGGGYLMAMPVAALACGLLAEQGIGKRVLELFALFLVGHAIVLLGGAAWLAWQGRAVGAVLAGVVPYLPAALVKSVAGTVLLMVARRV